MKILPDHFLCENRQCKPVKKIEHPTMGQLCWLFLPCYRDRVQQFTRRYFNAKYEQIRKETPVMTPDRLTPPIQ